MSQKADISDYIEDDDELLNPKEKAKFFLTFIGL